MTTPTTTDTNTNKINPSSATDLTSPGPVVGVRNDGQHSTGHGNPYLARVLGEAAVAAAKTDTFLGERYRRIARRRRKKKAIVAVGRSILVII